MVAHPVAQTVSGPSKFTPITKLGKSAHPEKCNSRWTFHWADIGTMNDIAAISSFTQSQTALQVAMAVAKKSLDATEAQGEAALKLLDVASEIQQQSLEPHKGQRLNVVG